MDSGTAAGSLGSVINSFHHLWVRIKFSPQSVGAVKFRPPRFYSGSVSLDLWFFILEADSSSPGSTEAPRSVETTRPPCLTWSRSSIRPDLLQQTGPLMKEEVSEQHTPSGRHTSV